MMIQQHAITNLIRTEEMALPLWYPQRSNFEWEHGGYCTHDEFYMHQCHLVYMAVFLQANLEHGPSGLELSTLPAGPPRPRTV